MPASTTSVTSKAHIVLLAKAPIPGFAKTRLIPVLGEEGASWIAQKLLQQACQNAFAVDNANIHLALTPAFNDPAWQGYAHLIASKDSEKKVNTYEQVDGDLGQRLIAACRMAPVGKDPVVVIGTDCPDLKSGIIKSAIDQLDQYDAVIQPVHDGGYAMLAMKRFTPEVFEEIRWSSEFTGADTREQFKRLGWSWLELDPVSDIDEGDDLVHCPQEWLQGLSVTTD